MNHYPTPVIRVLELAEAQTQVPDVLPAELRDPLKYCTKAGLVGVREAVLVGYTPSKTIRKEADELRPGDELQLEPGELRGWRVERVVVGSHTVKLNGPTECQLRRGAVVTVFDGPPPQPRYSEPKLVLLPEGEAALTLHRMTAGTAAAPNGGREAEQPTQLLRQESASPGRLCPEATGQGEGRGARGNSRRPRGRPRGSDTAASDRRLYLDWKAANKTTGITKAEFVRERGLAASAVAAIERGRAQEKRKRSGQK